jgi:mRNA interferase YafQ
MRTIRSTAQFKRDFKRQKKRGKNLTLLKNIVNNLVQGESFESKFHDHPLSGGYQGSRECHLEPDWQRIYELTDEELILIRTGSHSDLFD